MSLTALDRGVRSAGAAGVDTLVALQRLDLGHTFPAGAFDLVSTQYLHAPIDLPRNRILQAAATAVAPCVTTAAGCSSRARSESATTDPGGDPAMISDSVVKARRR